MPKSPSVELNNAKDDMGTDIGMIVCCKASTDLPWKRIKSFVFHSCFRLFMYQQRRTINITLIYEITVYE